MVMKGSEFLVKEILPSEVFTPEDFSDEQKQIRDTTRDLVDNEILPQVEEIDSPNHQLVVEFLAKAGELGLLMMDPKEEDGGLGLDKSTVMLVAEEIAHTGSFSVAFAAHTGIGTLPLVYYGSQTLKDKYLEKIITGQWGAAFCLTEPNAGSDAMTVDTQATTEGDHYLLNGTKQFITNGGFAKLFTVFARLDKEHFTAFMVEKDFVGVSIGPEENKMGIKGSSTTQVIFDQVKVPKENLLGEIGKGHHIAFNVLNIGRIKLGAAVNGAAKEVLKTSVAYAKERKQFQHPISDFGAIQEKIADRTAQLFAAESLIYRITGDLDIALAEVPQDENYYKNYTKIIADYNGECAIAKVYCSEQLAAMVDEGLQIYGGYGFIKDYPAERFYRDERINRLFEGTNEINRLLLPDAILKKSLKGELPLQSLAMKAFEGLVNPSFDLPEETLFAKEFQVVKNTKQIFLVLAGAAVQKFQMALAKEQEVLMAVADVAIYIYALESALLRAAKHYNQASDKRKKLLAALVKVSTFNNLEALAQAAKKGAFYIEEGDNLTLLLSGIRRYGKYDASGLLQAKRTLAQSVIEQGKYPL